MTPKFLDFSGQPQPHKDLFREINRLTSEHDTKFFVVGAFARDLIPSSAHGINVKRATEDIDCGIQVESWVQFEKLKASLIDGGEFKPHKKQQQRLIYRSEVPLDIVPFGAIEENGIITWPNEGIVMTTLGFEEAFGDPILVRLDDGVEISISTLPGLALMKLIAWKDRRFKYKKDAQDLGLLMQHYLDAGNDFRLWEGEAADLLDNEFDYSTAGARLLGRDVGLFLNDRLSGVVMDLLDSQTGEQLEYPLVEAMLDNFFGDFEKSMLMLESFFQGVKERHQRDLQSV